MESGDQVVVGRCALCDAPWENYDDGTRCAECRVLVLVCDVCAQRVGSADMNSTTGCTTGGDSSESSESRFNKRESSKRESSCEGKRTKSTRGSIPTTTRSVVYCAQHAMGTLGMLDGMDRMGAIHAERSELSEQGRLVGIAGTAPGGGGDSGGGADSGGELGNQTLMQQQDGLLVRLQHRLENLEAELAQCGGRRGQGRRRALRKQVCHYRVCHCPNGIGMH